MPHPLVPEGEGGSQQPRPPRRVNDPSPFVSELSFNEERADHGDLPSDLEYKDQGRTYVHFVNNNSTTNSSGVPIAQATPLHPVPAQRRPVRPDPSVAVLENPPSQSTGATTDYSRQTGPTTTMDGSAQAPFSLPSTSYPTSTGRGGGGGGVTIGKPNNGGEADNRTFLQRYKIYILAVLGVLLVAIVVVAVVAAGGGGDDGDEGDDGQEAPTKVFDLLPSDFDNSVDTPIGYSLSLNKDGTCMAVADRSSAQVYYEQNGEWTMLGNEIPPPPQTSSELVESDQVLIRANVVVQLSGDGKGLVVGWSTYQGNTGIVRVYRFNETSTEWSQQGQSLTGDTAGSFFGATLDFDQDGSVLAVGSPGSDANVKVYQFNVGMWEPRGTQLTSQIGGLTITSVALSKDGNTMAVGGLADADNPVARIFGYLVATGDWDEMGTGIKAVQRGIDGTAYVVDLSGDGSTLAISNYYYLSDDTGANNDGLDVRALRYSLDDGDWVMLGEPLHTFSPGEKEGYFLSLSDDGRTMVMGDPGRRGTGLRNQGHAHIYNYEDSQWRQQGPDVMGGAAGDRFGYAVALSGDGNRFAASGPFSRQLGTEFSHGKVSLYDIPN